MDDGADVARFAQNYHANFPVGVIDRFTAGGYMQLSPVVRPLVPFLLFVDRKGIIQAEYTGGDDFLKDESGQDSKIRAEAQTLLDQGKPAAARKHAK